MAQTKRRRQTKHRGNAAGVVESRGRTGRKPTAAEKSLAAKEREQARRRRVPRQDRPPTWLGALYRAMVAAALMLVAVFVLLPRDRTEMIAYFPIVVALYVPISYYTDRWLYKRRMRNKEKRGSGKAAA
jgi:hypothetical protein